LHRNCSRILLSYSSCPYYKVIQGYQRQYGPLHVTYENVR
jgi:hypothetical protein